MRKQLAAAVWPGRQDETIAGKNRYLQTTAIPENHQRARIRSAARRCPGHRKTSQTTANGIRRSDTSGAKRATRPGNVSQIRLQPHLVDREFFRFVARRVGLSRCPREEPEKYR